MAVDLNKSMKVAGDVAGRLGHADLEKVPPNRRTAVLDAIERQLTPIEMQGVRELLFSIWIHRAETASGDGAAFKKSLAPGSSGVLFQSHHVSHGPLGTRLPNRDFTMKLHVKARTEGPAAYQRQHVPDDKVPFDVPFRGYTPIDFTSTGVIERSGGEADPLNPRDVQLPFTSHEGEVRLDDAGRPINPRGRTGLAGRGNLWRWGANQAGDPLVTRRNPETGKLQVLLIQRKDTGEWALPGGMVDRGEDVRKTVARELSEETGGQLDFTNATMLHQGYVDDPRNTDNAWMESTVLHLHVPFDSPGLQNLEAKDDARGLQWVDLDDGLTSKLYASHAGFVQMARSLLE